MNAARKAVLYRMVTPEHTCPYGLKAKDLLERQGFAVEEVLGLQAVGAGVFGRDHPVQDGLAGW